MSLFLIMFGVIGYSFLGIREFPAIDPPVISVSTSYAGANSDVIETQITEPLEKAINGIPGVRTITSSSSVGSSMISIEFNLDANLEAAANDVRDKVSQAQRSLPQDVDAPPVVSKADANSDNIIMMAVQSQTKGLLELSDYAENVLQNKFQTIPEVSSVNIIGQKRPAMRLWLDPSKLSAYNIAFNDVATVLARENVEAPSGKLYGDKTELTIRTMGRLTSEKEFMDLIIKEDATGIVRLKDLGQVEIGPENYERNWKLNGVSAVGISITPQPGANYINISDEFNKRLEEIKKAQKNDIEFTVLVDNTRNIRRSLNEVKETLLISFILVILVIFFFFRDWLIAIRPLIDIPISLIATFFIMYLAGYSINILTLLGIILATGLVVDDGIVVTENIFRKFEGGIPIRKAALAGCKEIFFAVISTSITLAIVFLPVLFLSGFVGSLFREFAVVVGSAVLISAFVSLTITPVLNVLLSRKASHGAFYMKTEPFFRGMENGYKNALTRFIKVRWMAWVVVVVCVAIIFGLGLRLQSEIAPMEDKGNIRLQITGPEGASYGYMTEAGKDLGNFLIDSIPDAEFSFLQLPGGFGGGGALNSGNGRIGLIPIGERSRSQSDVAKDLNRKLVRFKDLRIFATEEQTISVGLGSRGGLPVQFVIQNLDFEKIEEVIPKFLDEARNDKTFQNVDVNLKFNKPEVDIIINRIKARELGLTVSDIASVIQSAFSGRRLAYFTMNGRQYQVISQVGLKDRQDPVDITKLYVRSASGNNIALSEVIDIIPNANPPTIYHYNRYKSATISASLSEGHTIGDGVEAMQAIANKLLDESYQTSLSGPSRDYAESSSNTAFAFLLALILIYLVLAAQFESFKDPVIIMITVPLAIAGAVLSLWIFGQTLNIFSEIGMIMLIGLVTKNGILIVEFANQRRGHGLEKYQAVIDASTQRLRPILMTSLATSLGALPIALSLGEAATSRIPLGIVIVGGIIFSLVLTLFVIPAVYTYISGKHVSQEEIDNQFK